MLAGPLHGWWPQVQCDQGLGVPPGPVLTQTNTATEVSEAHVAAVLRWALFCVWAVLPADAEGLAGTLRFFCAFLALGRGMANAIKPIAILSRCHARQVVPVVRRAEQYADLEVTMGRMLSRRANTRLSMGLAPRSTPYRGQRHH